MKTELEGQKILQFSGVLLRKKKHDSEDDFRSGCRNVSHCQQQQFFS